MHYFCNVLPPTLPVVYTSILKYTQVYHNMHRYASVYTGIRQYIQDSSVYTCVTLCVGGSKGSRVQYILYCTLLPFPTQVYHNMHRYASVYTGIRQYIQDSSVYTCVTLCVGGSKGSRVQYILYCTGNKCNI